METSRHAALYRPVGKFILQTGCEDMRRIKSWVFSGALAGFGAKRARHPGRCGAANGTLSLVAPAQARSGKTAQESLYMQTARNILLNQSGRFPTAMQGLKECKSWFVDCLGVCVRKRRCTLPTKRFPCPKVAVNVIRISARSGLTLVFAGTTWPEFL